MSNFTHLHVHTEYSLLDGLPKIVELVTTAKQFNMDALAITDHGVMYGVIEFYKECCQQGIKPILGMESYVSKQSHKIKEKRVGKYRDANHLVLLAKNFEGYQNLMKLTTIAHMEGFYYKPRFDKKTLEKHASGLICLSACMQGEIPELLSLNEYDKAKKAALYYSRLFGDNGFFLELQRHNYKNFVNQAPTEKIKGELTDQQTKEDMINLGLVKLSRELGLPLIATNDVHYITPDQATAQDALVCIQTGKDVSDTNRLRYLDTPAFYLNSEAEMAQLFPDFPEALSNTQKVVDQCDLEIKLGDWFFPHFTIPGGKSAGEYLKEISYQGAEKKYGQLTPEVKKRIDYELKVIEDRGYSPYFLIVGDMANWCLSQGIVTTTRGSAAGSIVLYVTNITDVDPLRYKLPFERFLNPFRPSPPDVDLDIADNRRGDLIAYITGKYGVDKVAQICTFGRMLARGSVRDIGRVLGFPYSFPDKIAKTIPIGSQGFPMTIKKALATSPELKELYQKNQDAKKILDLAREIEGNARHLSVHAAALVISPTPMTDFSPLQKESGGEKTITQYEMHAAEEVGLIKFDILGIRNLSILNSAIDIVQATTGKTINLKTIPLDDPATFAMLSRGETMGTFQLGGSGMTRYLMELKPSRVEDIMAMVALFRPGPMANIPEYIRRKNDPTKVKYLHPKMKTYLESSYGILVYQEDVLFTAIELAGYDWGSVDKLRKAIGKKIPAEMAKQEKIFVQGCQDHSHISPKLAQQIWDLFVPFQGYGFNKAHAAAYGIVAYQTAYMKANFPVEFMTAVLTAEAENTDKLVQAIEECKRLDIPVLPPDINTSETDFTIVPHKKSKFNQAIRFGLNAIKNVGSAAIDSIIAVRPESPGFHTLTQFCSLVDGRKVNKKVLESLIKVGAMDNFGTRKALIESLDKIRDEAGRQQQQVSTGQGSLFTSSATDPSNQQQDPLPQIEEYTKAELLGFEKQLLGLYLTEHPMAKTLKIISSQASHTIASLDPNFHSGTTVTLGGIITKVRTTLTKKTGSEMAFLSLEDETSAIDVVVFPRVWQEFKSVLELDHPVIISGQLDVRDDNLNLIASRVRTVSPGSIDSPDPGDSSSYQITIPRGTDKAVLQQIGSILKSHPGDQSVSVILPHNGSLAKTIPLPYKIEVTPDLESQIKALLHP